MTQTKNHRTKTLMTTLLIAMAAIMIAPSASATHTNCGDPVINPVGYGLCRASDAIQHCDAVGGTCTFVFGVEGDVYDLAIYVRDGTIEVAMDIYGDSGKFAVNLLCHGTSVLSCEVHQKVQPAG